MNEMLIHSVFPLLTAPSQIIASQSLYGLFSHHHVSAQSCFFEKVLNSIGITADCARSLAQSVVKRNSGISALLAILHKTFKSL